MFQNYRDSNILSSSHFSLAHSGFTQKAAGDMRKIQSIKTFFSESDISPRKIVLLEQIHSVNISLPDKLHLGEVEILEESDGVVTDDPGAALVVRVADCVPVLYFDPVHNIIGASHNGWRGSEKNMIAQMIGKMEALGAEATHIRIAFGPAIGECCYTVDLDRYIFFMERLERFEKNIFKPHGQAYRLNLTRLNYELALECGIHKKNIDFFPFCTSCDSTRFFSFRRQIKKEPQHFGEMMGYIML